VISIFLTGNIHAVISSLKTTFMHRRVKRLEVISLEIEKRITASTNCTGVQSFLDSTLFWTLDLFAMFGSNAYVCLFLLIMIASVTVTDTANVAIYSVKSQEEGGKKVALTFDDGPHGTLTPLLLDVLRDRKAKATFFVMGVKVALHKAVLERAQAEGHEIANHVWDHPVLTKMKLADVIDQISRTNEAIKDALGIIPKVMRPPYGNTNVRLNEFIQNKGNLSVVMWSFDTLDWQRPDPQKIVDVTVKKVRTGDIILCHDIHPGTIKVTLTTKTDTSIFLSILIFYYCCILNAC
jgi:peptidoglycan/xylan/chitin deacetylase (PgdA/CDA1 family)